MGGSGNPAFLTFPASAPTKLLCSHTFKKLVSTIGGVA